MGIITTSNDWTGTLNGLPIGTGTDFAIAGLDGWKDQDSQPLGGSGQIAPKQVRNGSWQMPHTMPDRLVTLTIEARGNVSGSFQTAVAQLEAATQPPVNTAQSLSIQLDGLTTTVTGFVVSRKVATNLTYQAGLARTTIQFLCFDPRRLAAAVTSSTGLPSSTGAFVFPHTFPMAWASTITSGDVVFTSTGDAAGPVSVTFYGGTSGVSGPSVGQVETGLSIAFSSSLTINPGDFLTVDMENRTVLYNGQSSRANYLISRGWMGLQPGANTFVFGSTSAYDPAPSMTVTAAPAYL